MTGVSNHRISRINIIVISKKTSIGVLMWEILIETHYRMN